MGADRNINPDQLRMFMTPSEIQRNYAILPGDRWEGETDDEFWARKDEENSEPGWDRARSGSALADVPVTSISNPVRLVDKPYRGVGRSDGVIGNGHHRVAAGVAQEAESDTEILLPVVHYRSEVLAANDGNFPSYGNYDERGNRLNWPHLRRP